MNIIYRKIPFFIFLLHCKIHLVIYNRGQVMRSISNLARHRILTLNLKCNGIKNTSATVFLQQVDCIALCTPITSKSALVYYAVSRGVVCT